MKSPQQLWAGYHPFQDMPSSITEMTDTFDHARLLCGHLGSEHGPCAFKAATLLMESSPQSICSIVIFKDGTQVPPETGSVQVQANLFKERLPLKHPIPLC